MQKITMEIRSVRALVSALALLAPVLAGAAVPPELESALKAHGGVERWRAFAAVEYDLEAEQRVFGEREERREHQVVGLAGRRALISGDGYRLGFDGERAWADDPSQLWRRPRFYHGLYFYLFSMPFVLADPGTRHRVLEPRTWRGQRYRRVRVTFAPGVGDSPGDTYEAWFDAAGHRLRLLLFTVTFYGPGMALVDGRHRAVEYLEWQEVDGLLVPRRMRLGLWLDDGPQDGELVMSTAYGGTATFRGVRFHSEPPPPELFALPPGGVMDEPGAPPADGR